MLKSPEDKALQIKVRHRSEKNNCDILIHLPLYLLVITVWPPTLWKSPGGAFIENTDGNNEVMLPSRLYNLRSFPKVLIEGPAQQNFLWLSLGDYYHFLWEALGRIVAFLIRNVFWRSARLSHCSTESKILAFIFLATPKQALSFNMCMDKSSSLIQHLKQCRIQRHTDWMSVSRGKDGWVDELFSSLCLWVLTLPSEGLWYGQVVCGEGGEEQHLHTCPLSFRGAPLGDVIWNDDDVLVP